MKNELRARKPTQHRRQGKELKIWSKLQVRMTISYVLVSVVSALLVELLIVCIFFLVIARSPFADQNLEKTITQTSQFYALAAASQSDGNALDPHTTFQPGQPQNIAIPGQDSNGGIPYIGTIQPNSQTNSFALLIAPNGQIVASSFPVRYPTSKSANNLLPKQAQLIANALNGKAGYNVENIAQEHIISVTQPIINKERHVIGAVYVQEPAGAFSGGILPFAMAWLSTALFWLILTAPIGAFFGMLTTRTLVRRLHRLVKATAQFAQGDYSQRVSLSRRDEIGQLEQQFNQMAEQLVQSIARQKELTEQQARMEERARIEQEMSTARYIQQALLPKEIPELPGWQIAPFYRPAREVGGDFYDFFPLENGYLGLVIGDATGKGVPAALVMATTCTMLRSASQRLPSPEKILAQVNDLLSATIPNGMFATCFFALLDTNSGRLCYANAGQDLPYHRHANGVSELRATGMPLGLMPGICYEQREVLLAPGDSLLFYTDGLVESHNASRAMFGFPLLKSLIGGHPGGSELIEFLLNELTTFTGSELEPEDDLTMVTVQRTLK